MKRLIEIGYTTHESASALMFSTELSSEAVHKAIVESAKDLEIYDLEDLLDDEEVNAEFVKRLAERGIELVTPPISERFIFYGWRFMANPTEITSGLDGSADMLTNELAQSAKIHDLEKMVADYDKEREEKEREAQNELQG